MPERLQTQPDEQSRGQFTGLVNPSSPGTQGPGSCPSRQGGPAGTGQPTGTVAYESLREHAEGVLVRVSDAPPLPALGPSRALGLGWHWVKMG